MSLYRCAVCGSSKVVAETKQEGYNKKKGIRGLALFGLGGAVAGTSGNTVVYYHCADCGHTLNRCMPGVDKEFLEKYLLEPTNEAYVNRLREYKKQYPNIEWEESTINNHLSVNTNEASISKDNLETADIHDIEVAIINALYEINMPCTMDEIQAMDNSCRGYSIPQLSYAAKCLVKANILEKNEVCFSTIPSSKKEALWLLHKMEVKQLGQEQEQIRQKQKQYQRDNNAVAMAILNALYTAKKPCSIPEMQNIDESCAKFSYQKIAFIATKLVARNILEKNIKDGQSYFKAIPASKDEAIKLLPN